MIRSIIVLTVALGAALAIGPLVARSAAPADDAPRIDAVEVASVAPADNVALADRRVAITGAHFYGTSFGPDVVFRRFDGDPGIAAEIVVLESGERVVAWPPPGTYGPVTVEVRNPDGRTASFDANL